MTRIRILCEPTLDPRVCESGVCDIRESLAAVWNTELDRIENRLMAVEQGV